MRVLVESLAEDPFRYKLLSVLAVGAAAPEVKRSATESSTFFQEEAQISLRQPPLPSNVNASPPAPDRIGSYDVDVFYCSSKRSTSEPIARKVVELKQAAESGRWRLRALPESVNQQPGYGVASNEIRFNAPEEGPVANILQKRLTSIGVTSRLRETQQATKWYVSVFVCQ